MGKETNRKACNVNTDDKIYGQVAEKWFEKCVLPIVKQREWTYFKCTKNPDFQPISVDYVISKKGFKELPPVEEVLSNRNEYVLIECKCDTWSWRTRNLYWEVQNKGSRGWSEKMKCDWLFYAHPEEDESLGTDEERTNKMVNSTKEILFLNAQKFREYKQNTVDVNIDSLRDRANMRGPNGRWYRRRDTYEKYSPHTPANQIIDIDFNIEELIDEGVVVWRKEEKDLMQQKNAS